MSKPSTEQPNGLLQSTEFTNNVTVTIKRMREDNKSDTVISFTNAPEVQTFYAQRGVALGISQQTNPIAVRVLALDLLKQSQHQQKLGLDSAPKIAEQARQLHAVAGTLTKEDALVCSFELHRPTPTV